MPTDRSCLVLHHLRQCPELQSSPAYRSVPPSPLTAALALAFAFAIFAGGERLEDALPGYLREAGQLLEMMERLVGGDSARRASAYGATNLNPALVDAFAAGAGAGAGAAAGAGMGAAAGLGAAAGMGAGEGAGIGAIGSGFPFSSAVPSALSSSSSASVLPEGLILGPMGAPFGASAGAGSSAHPLLHDHEHAPSMGLGQLSLDFAGFGGPALDVLNALGVAHQMKLPPSLAAGGVGLGPDGIPLSASGEPGSSSSAGLGMGLGLGHLPLGAADAVSSAVADPQAFLRMSEAQMQGLVTHPLGLPTPMPGLDAADFAASILPGGIAGALLSQFASSHALAAAAPAVVAPAPPPPPVLPMPVSVPAPTDAAARLQALQARMAAARVDVPPPARA